MQNAQHAAFSGPVTIGGVGKIALGSTPERYIAESLEPLCLTEQFLDSIVGFGSVESSA